jgi:hypothetical protein
MNIPVWKEHGTKLLGALGAVAGGLAMYLTPEQLVSLLGAKGPGAVLLAGGVLTYLRGLQNSGKVPGGPAPSVDPPSTAKSHWLVGMFVAVLALVGLFGCATKPTPTQQLGLDALTSAAVSITVQRDSSDPAVWAKRARLILSVAHQLEPLATDEAVSVPALAAAVGPLLDQAKLAPAERIAANTLVTALATVIDANTNPDNPAAATVAAVLASAIRAASVYAPLGEPEASPSTIF